MSKRVVKSEAKDEIAAVESDTLGVDSNVDLPVSENLGTGADQSASGPTTAEITGYATRIKEIYAEGGPVNISINNIVNAPLAPVSDTRIEPGDERYEQLYKLWVLHGNPSRLLSGLQGYIVVRDNDGYVFIKDGPPRGNEALYQSVSIGPKG